MKKPVTEERILQVINNVAEEYVDYDETDFATKRELCEAILFLRKESQDNSDKYMALRMKIMSFVLDEFEALANAKAKSQ